MRCGILIIGSLLWDDTNGRAEWRRDRLMIDQLKVRAPIHYGRKSSSRGDTFTMSFNPDEPSGIAVLVPCERKIETIADLAEEAEALWQAEAPNSQSGAIGKGWGRVSVLFGNDDARKLLTANWADHFKRAGGKEFSVVKPDGQLDIAWPVGVDGVPVDFDIILATATVPERERPLVDVIAKAWIGQSCGHERYFIENVRRGIRTNDDGAIWAQIESASPSWLAEDDYSEALVILRGERPSAE